MKGVSHRLLPDSSQLSHLFSRLGVGRVDLQSAAKIFERFISFVNVFAKNRQQFKRYSRVHIIKRICYGINVAGDLVGGNN